MRSRVSLIDFGTSLISGAVEPNVASTNTGLYQTQSSCRTAELVGIPEKSRNLRKPRFDDLSPPGVPRARFGRLKMLPSREAKPDRGIGLRTPVYGVKKIFCHFAEPCPGIYTQGPLTPALKT
jgi:hypothetical protein